MGTLCSFFEKKSNNTNIGMMNIYAHPWILSLLDIVMNWVPEIIIRIRFCFVLITDNVFLDELCYFLKLLTFYDHLIAFWILFPLNFLSKNWILNYLTTITICLPNHRFLNDPLFMTTQPFFALLHRHVHTIHIHKYTKTDYHLFSPSKQSFKNSCFCLAL